MTARNWAIRTWAGVAALVILASSALAQNPPQGTKPVAMVNGEPIIQAEVEAVLKLLPPSQGTPTEIQRRQTYRESLEMLIDDQLMRQFLNKNGRRIEVAEVNKKFVELENALKAQKKSVPEFLKETGQSEVHLRMDILKKLQWDDYINTVVTEATLQKYFQENKDAFDQVTVKASHILLRVPPTATEGDCQVAQAKLQDLRQKILAGQIDFGEAAKKYSQCASAPQGGDIGYFPRKWAVDEKIARAAFGLKVGEITDVVRSDYGFHLIKVTDRKPGQPSVYDKVKEDVRENYSMEMWQAILAQQRQTAKIDISLP